MYVFKKESSDERILKTLCKGITLIELVFTIVIMLILAATALMMWPGDRITVASQAEALAADIRYTQLLSMTSNARYRINLNNSSQYSILTSGGVAIIIPAVDATAATLPATMSLSTSSSSKYLIFDARGTPYTGTTSADTGTALSSSYTITITGFNGSRQVVVSPETGRVITQ